MPTVDLAAIREDVKKLLAKILEVDISKIEDETNLVDTLGADSMMALEIMAKIEKKYDIDIPEEELPKMTNLKQIMDLVTRLLKN
ncbi:MAG: acyl carrier protein [Candidatus Omnitrophica bacterium CG07_land_8_20_14_0_80_50_8]|nr:MAG: acyl carrier protein [Candidatus Omnitrophica bacterium CG07_land_8_20_14_0_80_50_8]